MDDEHVVVIGQHFRAQSIVFEICLFHRGGQGDFASLQTIVEALGYGEEIFVTIDQTPIGLDPKSQIHRDQAT